MSAGSGRAPHARRRQSAGKALGCARQPPQPGGPHPGGATPSLALSLRRRRVASSRVAAHRGARRVPARDRDLVRKKGPAAGRDGWDGVFLLLPFNAPTHQRVAKAGLGRSGTYNVHSRELFHPRASGTRFPLSFEEDSCHYVSAVCFFAARQGDGQSGAWLEGVSARVCAEALRARSGAGRGRGAASGRLGPDIVGLAWAWARRGGSPRPAPRSRLLLSPASPAVSQDTTLQYSTAQCGGPYWHPREGAPTRCPGR